MQFRSLIARLSAFVRSQFPQTLVVVLPAGGPAYPSLRAGLGGDWPEERELPPRQPEPLPLTGEEAWSLATRPIVEACATADQAAGLQSAAAEQVDAAVYALERLLADLAPVMRAPQKRSGTVARVSFDQPRDRHAVSMRRTGPMPIRAGRASRAA